ncbi:hypothetical protein [Caldimonas tepidiphila]|uniref:hypothetical protein n=1 Tax=Caldimonas tepidiphila TaxID=2315841 RepID=UPI000E5A1233|nr:hypothetical protein [Caldimonas tepidiphila]
MNASPLPRLSDDELERLALESAARAPCPSCAGLACRGWEALPSSFDASRLRPLGTLQAEGDDEPTLDEYHPAGTRFWSPDAPIAPRHFPYNRCEVWQCVQCARAFLRYTEYGGYYVEPRIRELAPELLVREAPGA